MKIASLALDPVALPLVEASEVALEAGEGTAAAVVLVEDEVDMVPVSADGAGTAVGILVLLVVTMRAPRPLLRILSPTLLLLAASAAQSSTFGM